MLLSLFAADAYLVGLGVTVAIVVYPSFHLVGPGEWTAYHQSYARRIGLAAVPAWVIQGSSSLWWLSYGPQRALAFTHALLALAAVLVTVLGVVPRHSRLERHHDNHEIGRLEVWHWVRTLLWVAGAAVVLVEL